MTDGVQDMLDPCERELESWERFSIYRSNNAVAIRYKSAGPNECMGDSRRSHEENGVKHNITARR